MPGNNTYNKNKKRKTSLDSTESIDINDESPIDFLKNLSKEDQDQCFKYLKLATYDGDKLLESDILFILEIEIAQIKKRMPNETKWKQLLNDKLNKYESLRDRLKLRIEYNEFKN